MPMVTARTSRFSNRIMFTVSRISCSVMKTTGRLLRRRRASLDAMHELENVLVLDVDLQAHALAGLLEGVLEVGHGGLGLVERYEHDHREHAVGHRLTDVVDVGVLLGDCDRHLGQQAVAVGAERGDDDRGAHGAIPQVRVGGDRRIVYWTVIPMPSAPGSDNAAPPPSGRFARLDRDVSRRAAIGWPHPRWFTLPLGALSLTANYGILWYVVAGLPWLFGEPRPLAKTLYIAVPVTAVEALGFVIKCLVARPRPPIADPSQPKQIPLPFSKAFHPRTRAWPWSARSRQGRCTRRRFRRWPCWLWCCVSAASTWACTTSVTWSGGWRSDCSSAPAGSCSSRRRSEMPALPSRGGLLAVVVAAALVLAIGLAAAGAFAGCDQPVKKIGRPSAAVSSSAHGAVAYVTAKTFAKSVHPRVADTWGDIRAREFITGAFQQYGYFSLTQEFISGSGAARLHSANIIAVKEGESARRLIVGAHYDSAPKSEGYADNATGIGLLLETAARVKPRVTPYTI